MAKFIKKPEEPPFKSWDCKGCQNFIIINGYKYCVPIREGRHRTELRGTEIVCLDKTESGPVQEEYRREK